MFLDPLEGECGWLTPGKGFGRGGGSRTPLLFPEGWSGPETSAPAAARGFTGALLPAFWARGRRFLRTGLTKGGVSQNPRKRELWERWRSWTPRRPKPRKDRSSPGSLARARRPGPSVGQSAPPPRTRKGSPVAGCSGLGAQKAVFNKPASAPPATGPRPSARSSFRLRFEIRKSVRVAATAGRALRGIRRVWGET